MGRAVWRCRSRRGPPVARRVVGLDDEGAQPRTDGVAVHGEVAVFVALVQECQAVELIRGAEPDELHPCLVDSVAELIDKLLAHCRIRAIGGDDQVVAATAVQFIDRHGAVEVQAGAEIGGPTTQRLEQNPAMHRRHSVATGRHGHAVSADRDGVPMPTVGGQRLTKDRVDGVDVVQRRVGEDHTESEDIRRAVAFEDIDTAARHGVCHRDRGEQTARPATDAGDAHRLRLLSD
jgi:hypothetical protein